MILLDFNQIMASSFFVLTNPNKQRYYKSPMRMGEEVTDAKKVDINLYRHFLLNSIRRLNLKFRNEYGELVICVDSANSWRKDVFPNYKLNRKKKFQSDKETWQDFWNKSSQLVQEFAVVLPYRMLKVERSESDDIIATVCQHVLKTSNEKIVIVSGDKDFYQLHNERVRQYNPVTNAFVEPEESPAKDIFIKIVRGCDGDGIPNILSDDDVFLNDDKRNHPISTKKLNAWFTQSPDVFCENEDVLHKYQRNETLISFTKIPNDVSNCILEHYEKVDIPANNLLMSYLLQNKCDMLFDSLSDFQPHRITSAGLF